VELDPSHTFYETISAAVIILNVVFIAWETEVSASRAWTTREKCQLLDQDFLKVNITFSVLFVLDLALRMLAEKSYFFQSQEVWFNVFDIVVVISSVLESAVRLFFPDCLTTSFRNILSTTSMLRMGRLLRVIKVTRAVRSLLLFRELRVMVSSLCGALVSLMWSTIIFVLTFFVFGVFFTDGVVAFAVEQQQCPPGDLNPECQKLQEFYGSLFNTMASLYWAVSGGQDWGEVLRPLKPLRTEYSIVFYGFITFSMFAMLNVVTSVFVDSTMQRSQNDREYVVQVELQGKKMFIETMEQVFDELDSSGAGHIGMAELEEHMNDPKLIAYFSALSLDIKQVRKLFHLIDADRSGLIDREEFIHGCFNLKGNAKNLDVAILQYESRRIGNLVLQLGEHIDEMFATMKSLKLERR